jgi:hypothetical protein
MRRSEGKREGRTVQGRSDGGSGTGKFTGRGEG